MVDVERLITYDPTKRVFRTPKNAPSEVEVAGAFVMSAGGVMDGSSTGPRCDRCGAAAKWLYLDADTEWQWCAHHDREHKATLLALRFDRYELALSNLPDMGARVPSMAADCCEDHRRSP